MKTASLSGFPLCFQTRGGPACAHAAARQHPAGSAPPAAAVRPESVRWPRARAAKPGTAVAEVPHHYLQVSQAKVVTPHELIHILLLLQPLQHSTLL